MAHLATTPRIPAAVWALGFVSLLMDISSELIHSLLPVFMVTTLGTSVLAVGLIEGLVARIKDEFGGRTIRVRGHAKVMTHLMFGILALTVDQLLRMVRRV